MGEYMDLMTAAPEETSAPDVPLANVSNEPSYYADLTGEEIVPKEAISKGSKGADVADIAVASLANDVKAGLAKVIVFAHNHYLGLVGFLKIKQRQVFGL